jgi:hypothetical protein
MVCFIPIAERNGLMGAAAVVVKAMDFGLARQSVRLALFLDCLTVDYQDRFPHRVPPYNHYQQR